MKNETKITKNETTKNDTKTATIDTRPLSAPFPVYNELDMKVVEATITTRKLILKLNEYLYTITYKAGFTGVGANSLSVDGEKVVDESIISSATNMPVVGIGGKSNVAKFFSNEGYDGHKVFEFITKSQLEFKKAFIEKRQMQLAPKSLRDFEAAVDAAKLELTKAQNELARFKEVHAEELKAERLAVLKDAAARLGVTVEQLEAMTAKSK